MNDPDEHRAHALLGFPPQPMSETFLEIFFLKKFHIHEVENHLLNLRQVTGLLG